MREILFKAKHTKDRKWAFGCYVTYTSLHDGNIEHRIIDDIGDVFIVDGNTVCQHIGLTDKNRTKAFESDKIYDPHENRVFTIYWDKETAAFCLCDGNGWMKKDISRLSYCEIIGNIHDKEE